MFGTINYFTFLASSVMLNITPGSDTIYIISRSAVGGKKEGIISALGICTGILIHTVLTAFGLSAILAGSKTAFNIMKILGAVYLAAMGIMTVFSKKSIISSSDTEKKPLAKIYRQGVLTNALNPKVALFFLALIPQFVSPDNTYGPVPFLILGLTFFATSSVWCTIIAFLASFISRFLNKNQKVSIVATKITGIIYILLGLNILRG